MARKKDFGNLDAFMDIATGKQHPEIAEDEKQIRAEELRTQGAKGCKAYRINMAFTPANYDFICVMSRIRGKTMTKYLNQVLDDYREYHSEIYEEAKALIDKESK